MVPSQISKPGAGHLAKIVAEGRDDLAIAQQMQAVVASLEKTETPLVPDHIEHPAAPLPEVTRDELAQLGDFAHYRENPAPA